MENIFKENSKMERLSDKEGLFSQQVIILKDQLKTIELKERENIMVDQFSIMDNGKVQNQLLEAID